MKKVGVTGVILYRDGFFFQYIEGIEKNLEAVYQRIERSTGHNRIYIVECESSMPRVRKVAYGIFRSPGWNFFVFI